MVNLPSGAVTFLFTDIESSTVLWERDRAVMAVAVERQIALLHPAIQTNGDVHFKNLACSAQARFLTASAADASLPYPG